MSGGRSAGRQWEAVRRWGTGSLKIPASLQFVANPLVKPEIMSTLLLKLIMLAVFGIAMAHFEGVVVVYLRKAIGMPDSASNQKSVNSIPPWYLNVEKTREAATIVMLLVIAFLTGNTWIERLVYFLWTFAFWDLFYYLSLYILIKWPPDLKTTDVLFLIPRPWIAPVWFPVSVSGLTILVIIVLALLKVIF